MTSVILDLEDADEHAYDAAYEALLKAGLSRLTEKKKGCGSHAEHAATSMRGGVTRSVMDIASSQRSLSDNARICST